MLIQIENQLISTDLIYKIELSKDHYLPPGIKIYFVGVVGYMPFDALPSAIAKERKLIAEEDPRHYGTAFNNALTDEVKKLCWEGATQRIQDLLKFIDFYQTQGPGYPNPTRLPKFLIHTVPYNNPYQN